MFSFSPLPILTAFRSSFIRCLPFIKYAETKQRKFLQRSYPKVAFGGFPARTSTCSLGIVLVVVIICRSDRRARPPLGPTHPPTQWVPGVLSLRVKLLEREAHLQLVPRSRKRGAIHSLPHTSSRRSA
jgi:hypothetical protein